MTTINFFEKKSLNIKKLFPKNKFNKDILVKNVKPLNFAQRGDLTFFESCLIKCCL